MATGLVATVRGTVHSTAGMRQRIDDLRRIGNTVKGRAIQRVEVKIKQR